MEVAAPNSVNYSNQLPLGIESRSQRKLFFPSTGDTYSGDGTNICRLDLSYDGLIDTAQSYLMFDVKNTDGAHGYQLDLGQPLINRLRIECGGVVLDDIQNYNTLLAGVLVPAQSGVGNTHMDTFNRTMPSLIGSAISEESLHGGTKYYATESPNYAPGNYSFGRQPTAHVSADVGTGSAANALTVGSSVIPHSGSIRQCYKLVSGLLDNEKYLPLFLLNAPITLEITWENAVNSGTGEAGNAPSKLDISAVRYVAHTIDLERSFYDRLRMAQQNSGGVL